MPGKKLDSFWRSEKAEIVLRAIGRVITTYNYFDSSKEKVLKNFTNLCIRKWFVRAIRVILLAFVQYDLFIVK